MTPFKFRAGVPEGAILSTPLYNVFIAPLPSPIYQESSDIVYTDDVTQIIISQYRSKHDLINRTRHEIARINRFEKAWKIKTNTNKFQKLPIAQKNSPPITKESTEYHRTTGILEERKKNVRNRIQKTANNDKKRKRGPPGGERTSKRFHKEI